MTSVLSNDFSHRHFMYKSTCFSSQSFKHQKEFSFDIYKPLVEDIIVELGDIKDIAKDLGVVGIDKQLPFEIIFKEAKLVAENLRELLYKKTAAT